MSGASSSGLAQRFRAGYGAGPLHLLSVVACLALTAFLLPRAAAPNVTIGLAVWFVGGLLLHDFVLFPLYTLADRGALTLSRTTSATVPWINHLRIPALLAGLLLLIWFPLVLRLNGGYYTAVTGLSPDPYRGRWLLVTAVVFAASGLLYALRVRRASRRGDDEHAHASTTGSGDDVDANP